MNILEFMSSNPFLTFFIAWFLFLVIENIVTSVSQVMISKNCKCIDEDIEEEEDEVHIK